MPSWGGEITFEKKKGRGGSLQVTPNKGPLLPRKISRDRKLKEKGVFCSRGWGGGTSKNFFLEGKKKCKIRGQGYWPRAFTRLKVSSRKNGIASAAPSRTNFVGEPGGGFLHQKGRVQTRRKGTQGGSRPLRSVPKSEDPALGEKKLSPSPRGKRQGGGKKSASENVFPWGRALSMGNQRTRKQKRRI